MHTFLFGFLTATERTTFRQLLKVNGVGPKVALLRAFGDVGR
jgi:Holliday junction DNA helicase RuvA